MESYLPYLWFFLLSGILVLFVVLVGLGWLLGRQRHFFKKQRASLLKPVPRP